MRYTANMPPRLVVYYPLGDPALPIELLDVYAAEGVDIAECGWPARHPHFDGADVRASMARAGDPAAAWTAVRARLAGNSTQPLLMTYAGAEGPEFDDPDLLRDAHGLLVVAPAGDVSRDALQTAARAAGVAICAFLPLPLAEADIAEARRADGYAMLQAAPGVTGPRACLDPANAERLASLRAHGVTAPIVLGFGISSGEHAREAVGLGADGVVVGSAALRAALEGRAALATLIRQVRRGLDG